MSSEPSLRPPRGLPPLSAASRQRLQKVFEHAQRCVDKQDFDYAHRLFAQCLSEDPANLLFLQSLLGNLQKKFGEQRTAGRLAGLKIKSQRSTLVKATAKGDWPVALAAACAALALNPWEIATLLTLATTYQALHCDQCEVFCLRCALHTDAKNIDVNRQAGLALERMGQFDQAIACWQRVQLALPQDEPARQAIARLSVEQTIDKGGYDQSQLSGSSESEPPISIAQLSQQAEPEPHSDLPPEERLRALLAEEPTRAEHYLRLAELYANQKNFDQAEQLLGQGAHACGSGNLEIRSQIEEVQLRRVAHQLAIAEQRSRQEPSAEAEQLAQHLRVQANQVELETYAARAQRDPSNLRIQYELGLRLKRAGKVKEAITALQVAKADSRRLVAVLVELGECFQHLQQFKLALSHYEQAVGASEAPEAEIHRKALYRAGVLATGMKEWDRAERHLSDLATLDFGYRDVAERLDKIAALRDIG